ncbi:hypothetical protein BDY21DRAFT_386006 [Lineolata rhizophorae]|uniref:Lipid droplet-associated hydrolase n=1 Tax=Lineolata rhizophorae TaxID=578093 RepID=A0A6A6P047_9PEZI|nr:hypothetical protein BDY21DRAFT_386006 [Lineolata rhizophorae]
MTLHPSDAVHLCPVQSSSHDGTRHYLIFFIPGNPGLIAYYTSFLTHLYGLLNQEALRHPAHTISFQVYGQSLSGFEVSSFKSGVHVAHESPPYTLRQQIDLTKHSLEDLVKTLGPAHRVIFIGHSVGTYIALELIRLSNPKVANDVGLKIDNNAARRLSTTRITGSVLLFPTVTEIAQSKNGKRFGYFLTLPLFAWIAAALAKCVATIVPFQLLVILITALTGFPRDAAGTTAKFLKSKWGVFQSLHMARTEMEDIKADKWGEEVWGASAAQDTTPSVPKLYFYFGQNDHWVSDKTRDQLIRHRGRSSNSLDSPGSEERWKPAMEVDQNGIPHAFCICK